MGRQPKNKTFLEKIYHQSPLGSAVELKDGLQLQNNVQIRLENRGVDIIVKNMNTNCLPEDEPYCPPPQDRCSSASTSTSPDEQSPSELSRPREVLSELEGVRWPLFESGGDSGEISQRVSQRAVCWLMTVSWSRSIDDQCLWSALLLFHHFKRHVRVRKDNLQLSLLTCLMIATKLASSQPLSAKDVASLSRQALSAVVQLEAEFLQRIGFDIVIPHYMGELVSNVDLSHETIVRVEFLCQLMMVRSYRIFFDRGRINAMIRMVEGEEEGLQGEEIRKDVKQMLAVKDSQIVIRKFKSKMDVEGFLSTFL